MLDPALFRDQASDVDARLGLRGGDLGGLVEELRRLDAERREIIPVLEEARRAKKELGRGSARQNVTASRRTN